ncbi:MAG: hypothetical protein JO090_07285, partial [Rhizobacter sp.]|nr:hypothetical protein [Rhizobacter sp.]
DGTRYDDSAVAIVREDAPGVDTQTVARLGQRAEVRFSDTGTLSIMVDATLVGPATVAAPGTFAVLGQPVVVNADPALGPVTQFAGGYTGAASVLAGDSVEVHGVVVAQGTSSIVRASRVERLAALPAYLRATGIASATSPGRFALGALGVDARFAAVVPADSAIADGATVSVLAPAGTLATAAGGGPTVVAAQVRVASLVADASVVALSGSVSALDATAQRFTLAGVRVSYAGASVSPAGAPLAGRYVVVVGQRLADGSLQATNVTVRDGTQPGAELHGDITAFVSPGNFQVRGVTVDASSAALANCPASGLANGVYVELEGALTPTGVRASNLQCGGEPAGATVERSGVAGSVDSVARTFVLTTSSGATSVAWTATTVFEGVAPASLAGKRVQVEGQFSGSVLTARQIELDD